MLEEKLAEMKEQLLQTVASNEVRDLQQSLGAATAVLEEDNPDDHGVDEEAEGTEDDGEPLHEAKGRNNGFPNFVKIHVHPTTRMNNERLRLRVREKTRGRQCIVQCEFFQRKCAQIGAQNTYECSAAATSSARPTQPRRTSGSGSRIFPHLFLFSARNEIKKT